MGVAFLFSGSEKHVGIIIIIKIFGGVFMTVGGAIYKRFNKPIVFDRGEGLFWKGKKTDSINLENIHAIQLIRECVAGDSESPSFYSYELNLVLDDGERRNVIDQGGQGRVVKYAEQLGQFLDVRVWDAT